MGKTLEQVFAYVDSHKDEAIDLWKNLVNHKSYSRDVEHVVQVVEYLKSVLEKDGFVCKVVPMGNNGPSFVATLGPDRPGKPVVFSGHIDTVITDDLYPEEAFTITDGKAYGPGVLDMKGGIAIAVNTARALSSAGYEDRPIKIVLSGDEEISHQGSDSAAFLTEESKGAVCAFNMETSLMDGCLCIGRKGSVDWNMHVDGVEAHAGNDYTKGANAIEEMGHKIVEFRKLVNLEKGTTVSCGVIKGGTVSNAVPKYCEMVVDIRVEQMDELDRVLKSMKEICDTVYVPGTKTVYEEPLQMAPFATDDGVMKLLKFVDEQSQKIGLGPVGGRKLGGASDASCMTRAGVPVLCSCGVKGEWNHTTREYAVVDSLFERSKLYGAVIWNLKDFEKDN